MGLNSSSVAKRWEGAAPQLSLRPLSLLHPRHFQHPRPLRHRLHHRGRLLRDPPALQYLLDLWIPSTAQLMSGTLGPPIRRTGAAEPTSSWRVCLEVAPKCLGNDSAARSSRRFSLIVAALAFVPSSGAQL